MLINLKSCLNLNLKSMKRFWMMPKRSCQNSHRVKNSLDKDMQTRKLTVEKEIEKEITKAQEEINDLKKLCFCYSENIRKYCFEHYRNNFR